MSPLLLVLIVIGSLFSFLYIFHSRKTGRELPPGPRRLPIIGNLHMLGNLPHQSLYRLAKKHGEIMSIKLGCKPTIVVSSARAAELFLKTHDTIFASRPLIQASTYISYGVKGVVFTPYGPYWRYVRKLCTLHLLSASKIEYFASMRKEEIGLVVDSIKKAAVVGEVVDLNMKMADLLQDITYRMIFGQGEYNNLDFKPLIKEALHLTGSFNLADYVPFLGALDLQGLASRMKACNRKLDVLLEKIINDREQVIQYQKDEQNGFINILLSLMNQPMNFNDDLIIIDRNDIKAIIFDMIIAAMDTSSITITWTFSELLKHPMVMRRVQNELEEVVGNNRMVEEVDLPKFKYLDMVIKESLRLHPVAPLLIPRESMEDVIIDGYFIPKKSLVLVNTWAIGRDINAWSPHNVEEFFPERFKDAIIDLRGHDFQLLPFGSGRRGCPGLQLGLTTVKLVLAQLLHCFKWKLPDGVLPKDLDMSEKYALGLEIYSNVLTIPRYRLT